ncbi:energy transducer TonB [Lysobacter sp. N42]|uniref:energy transducer TonB n=1 Tax=Lysobacter sp. N42 TaxID=2545719 RepID=UPI00104BBDB5|nr:energy transducer TonB [Lysobacter sp. N42]TCZ85674.1 TonB family protein [Lysobacter sp. N42]
MNHASNAGALRATRLGLVLVLGLGLVACGGGDEPATTTATEAGAAKPAATPATVISGKVTSMTPEQLREAASKAYNENRLYAPAGDNAMEYYLALRDKAPGDAAVSSALVDLLPMTVIATEQSVARDDFAEAQRLSALIEKADAQHPALSRLKGAIVAQQQAASQRAVQEQLSAEEEAKRQAELEKQRLADQQKQQQEAARLLAERQAAERQAAERQAAERQAAERQAAERQAAERQAAERQTAQTAAAPARPAAANTELRALSTPAPAFPAEALRAAQSGEVQVEFTVAPDGSVTAARVVRSNPARVFDRAAVNAVKRWRFAPVDAPVTTRRTITFNSGT